MSLETYDVLFWLERPEDPRTAIVADIEAENWAEAAAIAKAQLPDANDLAFVGAMRSPMRWMGTVETLPARIRDGEQEVFLDDQGKRLKPGGLFSGPATNHFRMYTILGLLLEPDGNYRQNTTYTQIDKTMGCSWSACAHAMIDLHTKNKLSKGLATDYVFVAAIKGDVRLVATHREMTDLLSDAVGGASGSDKTAAVG